MNYFDNINLEKGMYHSEKSFARTLEALDPSLNYKGTDLANLDAYERQLKRFDIKVKGVNSDTVSKFFQNSQTATLFPEFIKRSVLQGVNEGNVLSDIVATKTVINALDYRAIAAVEGVGALDANIVRTGEAIPETKILSKAKLTALTKRGRAICMPYETIQF